MNETLRAALQAAGWRSGTHRGFLMTRRAGIDFEIGQSRTAGEGRLELLYRYQGEQAKQEGSEALPDTATLERVMDAMTGIYLRVHDRPDVSRVFGSRARSRGATPPRTPVAASQPAADALPPAEDGQGAFDL